MLHLPPEDYSDRGGSVGGGARSGAGGAAGREGDEGSKAKARGGGMACSSSLDF